MSGRSKKYRAALEKLQGKSFYSLAEAIALLKATNPVKFDATAELHMNLSLDSKKDDQSLRGTVVLPHGTGKSYKIAAVVSDDKVKEALAAGATKAGLEDLIGEFEKGKINYDIIIATPDVMRHLGKVAKTLGQKGMMPNPKSGTVTTDVKKTLTELKKGRVEYRNDKEGNVHMVFGKVSFPDAELENNLKTLLKAIRDSRPGGVKGTYVNSITITSTMAPGIRLNASETMANL
ncbi:MAG: 50S ribosomal protein L1 [Candidatus Peregrinibacteria bacterium]